ncbi:vacuolar membrane protein-domain-containing protein [Flagelloscypha sp. PMI_526]|nr:vacuolar membrane protein-domain-containing protein [Flagelloscypha sp. PMI_526]
MGPTGIAVQAAMGIFVLFDVSKQVVGQMFVHGVNVLTSDIVSQYAKGNACVFYFLNILLDILYIILHCLAHFLVEKFHFEGFESGVYGNPPRTKYWIRQTGSFLVVILLILLPGILRVGDWLLSWTRGTEGGSQFQVIFTLGIFPIIMNMIQFWIIDSIVKASGAQGVSLDHEATDPLDHADREPLFHANHPSRSPPPRRRDSHPSHPSGAPPTHKKGPSSGSMELHEYPPSLTHSLDSASTSSSSPRVATKLNNYKPKRRGPPSPISVPPNQAIAVASNSPWQTTPAAIQAPTPSQPDPTTQDGWDNWGD